MRNIRRKCCARWYWNATKGKRIMNNLRRIGISLTAASMFAIASFAAINPVLADTTPTPAPVTVPYFVSVATTTNVYDTPATTGDVEGQLVAGQTWYVLGIDITGKWVQVFIPSNSGLPSWVPANTLNLSGVTLPFSTLTDTSSLSPTAVAAAPVATTPSAPTTPIVMTVPFLTTVVTTTNVYDAPATTGDIEGQLTAGQTWYVLGKDSTGKWIEIYLPNANGLPAWVPINTLAVSGLNIPAAS
jgi:hypothetical protein